jgi:hypothetical protein
MNMRDNILKDVYAQEKVELSSIEVKLSDYVEITGAYQQLEKNYNVILKETSIARATLKKAVDLIQQQQVLTDNFNKNIVSFDKKAKDLGIDWKTAMPEFVKYQSAVSKQYAPQNLKEVIDAYNNL